MKRYCPVCRMVPLIRADLRTCGKQCAKEWGSWSPEAKARVLSQQNKSSLEILEDLKLKGIIKPTPYINPINQPLDDEPNDEPNDGLPKFMADFLFPAPPTKKD